MKQVFSDDKGYIQEVIVGTAKSCYRRDIRKLCLLKKNFDLMARLKTLGDVPPETKEHF